MLKMARFHYTARSSTGEKVEGAVEATDRRAATLQIERMGHVPVMVTEAAAAKAAAKAAAAPEAKSRAPRASAPARLTLRRGHDRMGTRDVLLFTSELSDLLGSGMNLGNALRTLARRKRQQSGGSVIAQLRDDIVRGASLSDALSKHPGSFSPLYVSMIRAGEASGALHEVMRRLVKHYERVQEVKEKVAMALVYPLIVLVVGVGTMIFLVVFVVPRFSTIFAELGSSLPLPTRILVMMSKGFVSYGPMTGAGIVLFAVLAYRALQTERGRFWWHRFQLKLPFARGIVSANAYARFARTLGILLANGVPVLRALEIVERTMANAVLAREIRNARDRVTDGTTISGPLAAGKVFPPLMTDMLAVGEESGDMSGALEHIATRYENELDRNVKIFTTALEPIMMVFIATFVGFVAVSLLLAVFDMTSGLHI
ncbi:MAG: type II secretion system F family protein [Kiritimatiellae bacterium]|nr:type II secretion system F family protein [Kiritimatiellia bacterium]